MTVVYTFPENRLAKLVSRPGGKSIAKAVSDAEKGLEDIRDEGVAETDRNIELLVGSAARACAEPDNPRPQREIYAHASVITAIAPCCGLAEVGEAAFSLCELTDRYLATQSWNANAVAVFISAIALLRAPDITGAPQERRAILEGLTDLVRRTPAPAGAYG